MMRDRARAWWKWRALLGLLALGWSAAAAELAPVTDGERFFVYLQEEDTYDAGIVTNVVWVVGTNGFKLAPVPGWRVRANGPLRRLELVESEGAAAVLLRFDREEQEGGEKTLKDWTEMAQARHPGFRAIRQFDFGSGSGPARVWDLVMLGEGEGMSMSTAARRVALISVAGGVLECTLSTSWRWLEELHPSFARLLVSVRQAQLPARVEGPGETPDSS